MEAGTWMRLPVSGFSASVQRTGVDRVKGAHWKPGVSYCCSP